MTSCSRHIKVFRRVAAVAFAIVGLGFSPWSSADSLVSQAHDDAFYRQLLKLPDDHGYQPTRSFTIIVDTEHGNQLVATDDPNLRFNLLWMDQFKPGYRSTRGGSAFGEIFRAYVKSTYKAYRDHHAQTMAAMPDENGSIHGSHNTANFVDAMDYNLKVTGDEVRFKIQYNY